VAPLHSRSFLERAAFFTAARLTAEVGVVRLTSAAADRFRVLAVEPSWGRVSFVEGGPIIDRTGWDPTLRGLRAMLAEASTWATYGFVKRGSFRFPAEYGTSLAQDWPPMPHRDPSMLTAGAFEDEFAPDAFGVQLLGPGYRGRAPAGASWAETPVGAGGVLLDHADSEAWFGELFVPFGGRPNSTLPPLPEVPAVLARARDDFDGLLFTHDVLVPR
jgi:hypothetical protein